MMGDWADGEGDGVGRVVVGVGGRFVDGSWREDLATVFNLHG